MTYYSTEVNVAIALGIVWLVGAVIAFVRDRALLGGVGSSKTTNGRLLLVASVLWLALASLGWPLRALFGDLLDD